MILALKQIHRSMEQNKQIDKKINQCLYGYSIYYIDTKNIQWRKDSLFNKQLWEKWTVMFKKKRTVTFKKNELDHYSTTYTKTNSKQIKNVIARSESIT